MIRKSDTGQGYIVICDLCRKSTISIKKTFKEVVVQIIRAGGEVRQEVKRTGSGIGPAFWRNYCLKCKLIEGILID